MTRDNDFKLKKGRCRLDISSEEEIPQYEDSEALEQVVQISC